MVSINKNIYSQKFWYSLLSVCGWIILIWALRRAMHKNIIIIIKYKYINIIYGLDMFINEYICTITSKF